MEIRCMAQMTLEKAFKNVFQHGLTCKTQPDMHCQHFPEGGVYGDACIPNWRNRHHTPAWNCLTRLALGQGRNALGHATFLLSYLHSLFVDATTLSLLDPQIQCYRLLSDVIDQLGLSSSSVARLLAAKIGQGDDEVSGIGCWVVVAIVRLCSSQTNSILWRIVKMTKVGT